MVSPFNQFAQKALAMHSLSQSFGMPGTNACSSPPTTPFDPKTILDRPSCPLAGPNPLSLGQKPYAHALKPTALTNACTGLTKGLLACAVVHVLAFLLMGSARSLFLLHTWVIDLKPDPFPPQIPPRMEKEVTLPEPAVMFK